MMLKFTRISDAVWKASKVAKAKPIPVVTPASPSAGGAVVLARRVRHGVAWRVRRLKKKAKARAKARG
jgi:hypothetical protein